MRIRVDHRAQRQLGDGGPWIFWRPRADGTREGLVLELLPCDNRECECRDVRVNGHLVDENLVEIHSRRGGLVLTYGGGAPARSMTQAVVASISFETGEVEAATEDAQTSDHDRVLAWILDELDSELLDRLHDEWLHVKGWRRRDTHDEGTWAAEWRSDTGRLVGWHEAFPDSRQDVYGVDGSVSLALDHYCINPGCACRQVRVALLAPDRSKPWTQFGDILYDLDSLGAARLNPFSSSNARLVAAVRAAFEKRYDLNDTGRARVARSAKSTPGILASSLQSSASAGRRIGIAADRNRLT